MCKKSKCTCIWVLYFTLIIGILAEHGIDQKPKKTCSTEPTISSAEEFKQIFEDKLYDDISTKAIEMLRSIHPRQQAYWESLLPDLSISVESTNVMRSVVQKSKENFERMAGSLDKNDRVQIVKVANELDQKYYQLAKQATKDMSWTDFNTIQNNHNAREYLEFKDNEIYKFVIDIHENWKDMYACIPEEYQKKYQDFDDIEGKFQEVLKVKEYEEMSKLYAVDYDKMTKIFALFSKLNEFFNDELKFAAY